MVALFRISGYSDDFYTGRTHDGRQVLMGLLSPFLVAYFFSPEGDLLNSEAILWEYPAPRHTKSGRFLIYDEEFSRGLATQFAAWWSEIGFEAGSILVKPFYDSERWVGIREIPDWLSDSEEHETNEDEQAHQEELREWQESGMFVLWWSKDYYMSANGEVEST